MSAQTIYQSILQKLSIIPVDYLQQVDDFLLQLGEELQSKEDNKLEILSLAGAWQDMPEEEFDDYLRQAKKSGDEAFGRDIIL